MESVGACIRAEMRWEGSGTWKQARAWRDVGEGRVRRVCCVGVVFEGLAGVN